MIRGTGWRYPTKSDEASEREIARMLSEWEQSEELVTDFPRRLISSVRKETRTSR